MMAGELDVDLVPQGTLIERIRAGGYGLGGILTQTGLGTPVETGKQQIEVEGKRYLLETALRADRARGDRVPGWRRVTVGERSRSVCGPGRCRDRGRARDP